MRFHAPLTLSLLSVALGLGAVVPAGGRFLASVAFILLSAVTLAGYGARARASWPNAAPAVARLMGLAIIVAGCHDATTYQRLPVASLSLLAAAAFQALALFYGVPAGLDDSPGTHPGRRLRWTIAAGVFGLAMPVSIVVHDAFSVLIAPDTTTYWATPREFFTRTPGVVPIRTPHMAAVFVAVQLLGGGGYAFLAVQWAARAFLAAAVAAILSGISPFAGVAIGILLALDPVSAATGKTYLTESGYTSALLFSVVVAVAQMGAASDRWRRWPVLIASGFATGLALLIRPSSLALMPLIAVAYWVGMRSFRAGALAGAGCALSALTVATFNLVKTGFFTVVAAGLFVAYPLFVHQLFQPANGSTSAWLAAQLEKCEPGLDYSDVRLETSNRFVYTKLLPCALAGNNQDRAGTYKLLGRAYGEAIVARPVVAAWRLGLEGSRYLGETIAYYAPSIAGYDRGVYRACNQPVPPSYRLFASAFLEFVCPIAPPDMIRSAHISAGSLYMRMLYQPYLFAYDQRVFLRDFSSRPPRELTGAAALLFFGLALAVVRPRYRPLLAAAIVVILANAAVTAVGHVTLTRYVAVLSPFFLIVSGLVGVSLLEQS